MIAIFQKKNYIKFIYPQNRLLFFVIIFTQLAATFHYVIKVVWLEGPKGRGSQWLSGLTDSLPRDRLVSPPGRWRGSSTPDAKETNLVQAAALEREKCGPTSSPATRPPQKSLLK